MPQVDVICAGCGKALPKRDVEDPYYGPPRIHGCCENCFGPFGPIPVEEDADAVIEQVDPEAEAPKSKRSRRS